MDRQEIYDAARRKEMLIELFRTWGIPTPDEFVEAVCEALPERRTAVSGDELVVFNLKAMTGHEIARAYVNQYHPTTEQLVRFLEHLAQELYNCADDEEDTRERKQRIEELEGTFVS
ncbi:hypothetical protein HY358_01235 [Candidatus Roizmanbacteria bacterium]|nr:hypothetical protein [Candidatus Roizmanbacteria bacterium]